jgi:hypothetical protein
LSAPQSLDSAPDFDFEVKKKICKIEEEKWELSWQGDI